jgi:hypothetical protein
MKEITIKYYNKMQLFFRLAYGSLILCYTFSLLSISNISKHDNIMMCLFSLAIIFSWTYLLYLWKLVKLFNKSILVWIGGAFVTAPIGPIITYYNMSKLVKNS